MYFIKKATQPFDWVANYRRIKTIITDWSMSPCSQESKSQSFRQWEKSIDIATRERSKPIDSSFVRMTFVVEGFEILESNFVSFQPISSQDLLAIREMLGGKLVLVPLGQRVELARLHIPEQPLQFVLCVEASSTYQLDGSLYDFSACLTDVGLQA